MADILVVGSALLMKEKEKMQKEQRTAMSKAIKEVRNKYIKYRF